MSSAAEKNNTGRSKYKCGICGQPKKGHICQAVGGTIASQGDEDVSHERQRLLAKLQQRLGTEGSPAAGSNEGSPTPPDSGSSAHSLSATSRHGVTVNIPEAGSQAEQNVGEQMSEAMSEARPMSMDLGPGPMCLDLGNMPSSPSMGMPMWTPPADGLNMWAQSNNLPSPGGASAQMWMPPSSPGAASMYVMPPSPGSQLKVGSPSAAQVPLWSQIPPSTSATPGYTPGAFWGSGTTPGAAATPFWHSTPAGGVSTSNMWPHE
jgi:hypothetical protein